MEIIAETKQILRRFVRYAGAVTLSVCLLGGAVLQQRAMAQLGGAVRPQMQARRQQLQKTADELGLSEAQRRQIREIMKNSGQKSKAINDKPLTARDRRTKLEALRKSTREQIMNKMTPDQKTKFLHMQQKHRLSG